uniref:Galectin n=1 Tax=Panagrolaimus davidi TaxID=227884 RepID=A0A914QGX2_9BILA
MNIKKGRYSCYCFQSCDLKFQWQKKHECFGNSQNVCNYLLKSGINENDIPLEGKPVKVVINEIAYNVSTIFNDIEYLNITEKWKQILEANKWDSNDNEKMLNFNITKNRNLIFEQYIAICDTVKWKSEEYRIIEKNLKTEEEEIVFPKNLYDVKFEEIDQWGDDKEIRMIITNNDKQSICPEQIVFELDEKSSIKKSWNLESEMNNDIFDFPPKLEISPGKEHRGSGFILNGNIPNFTITFKNCNLISRTGPEGFHLKALEILSDGERKKFIVTAYNRIQKPLYCGSFALFFSNNTKIESMWNMKKRTTKNENDYDFPDWLIFKPGEFYAETGFILSEGDLQDAKGIIHRYSDGYNHELQYCPLYGFQIEIISTSIIENNLTKIDFKVVNYDIKPICKGRFELEISKDSKILSLWNMKRSSRQEVYEYTFPQPWRLEPSQTVQNMGIIIEGKFLYF